jgi:hypothetical protein
VQLSCVSCVFEKKKKEHCHKLTIEEQMIAFQADGSLNILKRNIFKASLSRELLILKRNSPVQIFKAVQITFLAFVLATLFFRTEMKHDKRA